MTVLGRIGGAVDSLPSGTVALCLYAALSSPSVRGDYANLAAVLADYLEAAVEETTRSDRELTAIADAVREPADELTHRRTRQ